MQSGGHVHAIHQGELLGLAKDQGGSVRRVALGDSDHCRSGVTLGRRKQRLFQNVCGLPVRSLEERRIDQIAWEYLSIFMHS